MSFSDTFTEKSFPTKFSKEMIQRTHYRCRHFVNIPMILSFSLSTSLAIWPRDVRHIYLPPSCKYDLIHQLRPLYISKRLHLFHRLLSICCDISIWNMWKWWSFYNNGVLYVNFTQHIFTLFIRLPTWENKRNRKRENTKKNSRIYFMTDKRRL